MEVGVVGINGNVGEIRMQRKGKTLSRAIPFYWGSVLYSFNLVRAHVKKPA